MTDIVVYAYNPRTREMETGGSLELAGQSFAWTSELQIQ